MNNGNEKLNFAELDNTNGENLIDEKDIEQLQKLLVEEDINGKNKLIEKFNYELAEEDKNKLSNILRNKLGLINGNKSINIDKEGTNQYLYKALVWIENTNLAHEVQEQNKEEERKKEEIKANKRQEEVNLIIYTYTNEENYNRIYGRLKEIKGVDTDLIKEMHNKIFYLKDSNFSDNEKKDIISIYNKGFEKIERTIHTLDSKTDIEASKILNNKIFELAKKFPNEIDIGLYDAGVGIAEAVANAGKKVAYNIEQSLTGIKGGYDLGEIKNFLMGMSTSDWLNLPGEIIEVVKTWGDAEFKTIKSYFYGFPKYLSGTYKTVIRIKNFIDKLIPKIIQIIGPGKFLKILKFPGLIGKAIKSTNFVKSAIGKTMRLKKIMKLQGALIGGKFLEKLNKIAPEKLIKIISKGEITSLTNSGTSKIDKLKILLEVRKKILHIDSIKKTKEYVDALKRINRNIEGIQLTASENGYRYHAR